MFSRAVELIRVKLFGARAVGQVNEHAESSNFQRICDPRFDIDIPPSRSKSHPIDQRATLSPANLPDQTANWSESEHLRKPYSLSRSSSPSPQIVPECRPFIEPNLTPQLSEAGTKSPTGGFSQGNLSRLIQNLVDQQEGVALDRIMTRQQRASLRYKRHECTDVGAELLRSLNLFFAETGVNSNYAQPIASMFEKYQNSWNNYLELEDSYDEVEDSLDNGEYELEKAEEKLRDLVERHGINGDDRVDQTIKADPWSSDGSFQPDSEKKDYHPLMAEYLSRQGDANLLKEQLWILRVDYERVHQQEKKLGTSGLDEEMAGILTNFKKYEKETLDRIEAVEIEVQQLKLKCDKQGLQEESSNDSSDDSASTELNILESVPENTHMLWERLSPKFFEEVLVQEPISTSTYVNKWLLHQLCQSSLDVLRLKLTPGLEKLDMDNGLIFRNLVYEYWLKDDAMKPVARPFTDHFFGNSIIHEMETKKNETSMDMGDLNSRPVLYRGHKSLTGDNPQEKHHAVEYKPPFTF